MPDAEVKKQVLSAINQLPEHRVELEATMNEEGVGSRLERADGMAKAVKARMTLELIDTIEGRSAPGDQTRACVDVEDFWNRTRHVRRPGPLTEWIEEDIIRIMEKVVLGESLAVYFRAGLII